MFHEPLSTGSWLLVVTVTAAVVCFSIWKGLQLNRYVAAGSVVIAAALIPLVSILELMTYSYPAPELPQLVERLMQAEPLAGTVLLLHLYVFLVPVYLILKTKH
ncbi:hypothetical protein ACFO4L_02970 [Bacillus daqingensis]|uniref:Uncharacterized protein n=1 Tax=Bacillus daqingensis TaxID=872396 RepID=A0ABV9NQ52_9BACI